MHGGEIINGDHLHDSTHPHDLSPKPHLHGRGPRRRHSWLSTSTPMQPLPAAQGEASSVGPEGPLTTPQTRPGQPNPPRRARPVSVGAHAHGPTHQGMHAHGLRSMSAGVTADHAPPLRRAQQLPPRGHSQPHAYESTDIPITEAEELDPTAWPPCQVSCYTLRSCWTLASFVGTLVLL